MEKLENRHFTISSLNNESPHGATSVLYEIVSARLNHRKICSRWVQKMMTNFHKTKRVTSALTFFTRYSDEGDQPNCDWCWDRVASHYTKTSVIGFQHGKSWFWYRLVDFLPWGGTINDIVWLNYIVRIIRKCVTQFNTKGVAYTIGESYCFTTILGLTWPDTAKTSLRHIAGEN